MAKTQHNAAASPSVIYLCNILEDHPIPGSVQGHVGWSFEQSGLVEDVLAHGSRVGTKVPSHPNHSVTEWPHGEVVLRSAILTCGVFSTVANTL